MISGVVRVSYNHMYDLYFRTRNVKLEHVAYRVEFMEWVKAGVAFNARGIEVSTRKIAYFGQLYELLASTTDYHDIYEDLRIAVTRYYEDLFLLYQDHLAGVLSSAGKKGKAAKHLCTNFVLLPSFAETPRILDVFPKKVIDLNSYVPAHEEALRADMVQLFVEPTSELYKCMAMYYDHSLKSDGDTVLLEVNECQLEM